MFFVPTSHVFAYICAKKNIFLGTMIGAVGIHMAVSAGEAVNDWTFEDIETLLHRGSFCSDDDAKHVINCMLHSYRKPMFQKMANFLGESDDITGGTIGEPRTPAAWVSVINDKLEDALIRSTASYFLPPPFSKSHSAMQALALYMWRVYNDAQVLSST